MTSDRGLLGLAKVKLAAAVIGILTVSIVGAVAFGVVGAPTVEGVDNEFGEVTDETTIIHTDLLVHNPNPIDIQLGDTEIEYTVRMNNVSMATGGAEGLDIQRGNSTQAFETAMDNTQIPPWWVSHIRSGERTDVSINATVHTSVLGEREFDITQERDVQTDLIGEFNSEETRPIHADDPPPLMDNPVLYVNRTGAQWGAVTDERTPIDIQFVLYNPQVFPYTFSELGYEITMNGVPVGEGQTDDVAAIPPGATEELRTSAAIRNQNLDDWWVTHLQNDQRTQLRIEFYAVVSADELGEDIHIPLDELTYEETIETDIFDNKDDRNDDSGSDTGDSDTPTPTPDGSTPTPDGSTPTPTSTPTDDGIGI